MPTPADLAAMRAALEEASASVALYTDSSLTLTTQTSLPEAEADLPPPPPPTERFAIDPVTNQPVNPKYKLVARPCRRCGSRFRYRSIGVCVKCQNARGCEQWRDSVAERVRQTGTTVARPAPLTPRRNKQEAADARQLARMIADWQQAPQQPPVPTDYMEGTGYSERAGGKPVLTRRERRGRRVW